jgi:hypothetical protein
MTINASDARELTKKGDMKSSKMYENFLAYIMYVIDINCNLGSSSCKITNLDVLDKFTHAFFVELARLAKSDLEDLGYTVSDVDEKSYKFDISWSE